MFTDAYTTIEHGKATHILDCLNEYAVGSKFENGNCRLISHALPFYNGYDLFEVSDFDNFPARVISFLYKSGGTKDDIFILDGSNMPIYGVNKISPLFLSEKNIASYARFFFHYVSGKFGRFHIIDSVDDINWREEPALAGRKALTKMIEPLAFVKEDAQGNYHLKATIIFKSSLFESSIIVAENGDVSINNQEMLIEDIPILDDAFQL